MTAPAPERFALRDPRDLLSANEFEAVATTVVGNNPGMARELAERITAEALAFVATGAQFPGQGMRPSRVVDEGWHALILHTYLYKRLCDRLGVFVHHFPEPPDPSRYDPDALIRTTDAIRAAGFDVDADLWKGPEDRTITVAADCQHGPGSPEGTCSDTCSNTGPN